MFDKITKEELKKFRSIPFWSWNDKLDKDKLIAQIDWMKENGIGGFFMHARSGLITEYLSEEWMKCVEACAEHAEKLGMDAWIYDENGWPSGFVGGKLLSEDENHDRYLTYSVGAYDENSMVSYIDKGDRLVRSNGGNDGVYINVYEHLSASTADILNPDVTDKFIEHTHKAYKDRYGDKFSEKIKGFFTDEPQYYRWGTPYTVMIKKYFAEVLGEDILDGIGLLFFKKEGYREFRYKYWSGMQQLMLNNHSKRVFDWCNENGVMVTGHYVEESTIAGQMLCCSGIMPFYEYEHIPGIDWLGRDINNAISMRQVISATKQLGKRQVLCEMYAGCGWDVTPRELKYITEYLYLNGVNITCQHLLPYSERGMRGHDYPAHYSDVNPWVKYNFKEFNDYFTDMGAFMANSEENVRVAVLHPLRSAYFDFEHREGDGAGIIGYGITDMDVSFSEFCNKLEEKGIVYHFLDETLLKKYGSVDGKSIRCGECSYDYLIIPDCVSTMDESTEKLIRAYVENGGKLLLDGKKPEYITWKPYSYGYLESNTDYNELSSLGGFTYKAKGGRLCISPRSMDSKSFIVAINHSLTEECEVEFDFGGKYTCFEMSGLDGENAKSVGLSFKLAPNQSAILIPSQNEIEEDKNYEIIVPDNKFTVEASDLNSLVIDKISYSQDGVNFGESKYIYRAFLELLENRYEGNLYLKYEFEVKNLPSEISFGVTLPRVKSVCINQKELPYADSGEYDSGNIAEHIKIGKNEIVLQLDYFQNENVYYVLFGENVTESLKNCLVYDSEFEPLVIKGNFGVYEKNGFVDGKTLGVRIGSEFIMDKPQSEVYSLVDCGYPFFAGKITLSQKFIANSDFVKLKLDGRWHIADLKVNGEPLGKLMFEDTVDISSAVKNGENILQAELTIGNRNLYGPHHFAKIEEPFMVGPFMFECNGASAYRDTSAFVEPLK